MITIAELRARNGKMSQKELADEIGTTQTSISLWEKDISTISSKYLTKICIYFGVSSDDLLGLKKKSKNFYREHDFKSCRKDKVSV